MLILDVGMGKRSDFLIKNSDCWVHDMILILLLSGMVYFLIDYSDIEILPLLDQILKKHSYLTMIISISISGHHNLLLLKIGCLKLYELTQLSFPIRLLFLDILHSKLFTMRTTKKLSICTKNNVLSLLRNIHS